MPVYRAVFVIIMYLCKLNDFIVMNAILIETSASTCSAALASNGQIIKTFRSDEPMQHAVYLPKFVEDAVALARSENISVDAVAVSGGPGSYTGLRIGVSTAKGLCYALGAKLIAVNTLHLIALEFAASHSEIPSGSRIIPMIDARRMEVFTQVFSDTVAPLSDAEAKIIDGGSFSDFECPLFLCGSGASKCSVIQNSNVSIIADVNPLANENMLALTTIAYEDTRFEDVAYYEPFYLKEFYTTSKN